VELIATTAWSPSAAHHHGLVVALRVLILPILIVLLGWLVVALAAGGAIVGWVCFGRAARGTVL
jgi:hypothetical protein